jgi:hypothetical protein
MFPLGADRAAASAAACLLMPALTEPGDAPALLDDEDLTALPEILATATASSSTEVRVILARTLAPVWTAPCGPGPRGSDRCRHAIAWAAVEAGARHVALGPLEFPAGHRGHRQLEGPPDINAHRMPGRRPDARPAGPAPHRRMRRRTQ